MAEAIQEKLKQSLRAAEGLYHRMVLLVGESGSGKTEVLREFAEEIGTEVININLLLSAELLGLSEKQRALHLPEILDKIVDTKQVTVVLDNIEILFDQRLKQDPLKLLQLMSRNRSVIAAWNGKIEQGRLIYAETGHPEYRQCDGKELLFVGMNGTATIDSALKNEAV
ncbi:MAG: BREX-3 system P-loop-containing protein BrxF [Chlorobiaceae bacterium]|nr:BREX-3 system P-loop-containing protein BrxF [Chlorobiaceae bacterium]